MDLFTFDQGLFDEIDFSSPVLRDIPTHLFGLPFLSGPDAGAAVVTPK